MTPDAQETSETHISRYNVSRTHECGPGIGVFGQLVTILGGTGSDFQSSMRTYASLASSRNGYGLRYESLAEEGMAQRTQLGVKESGDAIAMHQKASAAQGGAAPQQPVAVRKDFADSAYWTGSVVADANGVAEIELPMPENLTTWKIHTWSLGHGTIVGICTVCST